MSGRRNERKLLFVEAAAWCVRSKQSRMVVRVASQARGQDVWLRPNGAKDHLMGVGALIRNKPKTGKDAMDVI
jgi:hypothetical protein